MKRRRNAFFNGATEADRSHRLCDINVKLSCLAAKGYAVKVKFQNGKLIVTLADRMERVTTDLAMQSLVAGQ